MLFIGMERRGRELPLEFCLVRGKRRRKRTASPPFQTTWKSSSLSSVPLRARMEARSRPSVTGAQTRAVASSWNSSRCFLFAGRESVTRGADREVDDATRHHTTPSASRNCRLPSPQPSRTLGHLLLLLLNETNHRSRPSWTETEILFMNCYF